MSAPDRLVWGRVPDEEQIRRLRDEIHKTVHCMKPPMPNRYADDLVNALMAKIEVWDWWRMRWYGEWDD